MWPLYYFCLGVGDAAALNCKPFHFSYTIVLSGLQRGCPGLLSEPRPSHTSRPPPPPPEVQVQWPQGSRGTWASSGKRIAETGQPGSLTLCFRNAVVG